MSFAKKLEDYIESQNSKIANVRDIAMKATEEYRERFKNTEISISLSFNAVRASCSFLVGSAALFHLEFFDDNRILYCTTGSSWAAVKSKDEMDDIVIRHTYMYMPNYIQNQKEDLK